MESIIPIGLNSSVFTGNVYFYDGLLIDVGRGEDVIRELTPYFSRVKQIVLTHSHFDHIENLERVIRETSAEVYAGDASRYSRDIMELRGDDGDDGDGDGDVFESCAGGFRVLHTPGHIDDAICLFQEESGVLFSGDTFLPGSFGRTDLEEGDGEKMVASLQRLAGLKVREIYPGHGIPILHGATGAIKDSLALARSLL